MKKRSRRDWLWMASAGVAALGGCASPPATESTLSSSTAPPLPDKVIDIHQHTNYWERSDDDLVAHQRALGVTKTVLLPAGSQYGLAVGAGGNDSCAALAERYPDEFVYFANELPNLPETRQVLEKYLKKGAIGIGEQKFPVDCDSEHIELIASIAQEYDVPVLMHFEYKKYNFGIDRFHKILEKFPMVNFIGHANTWWGSIDKDHRLDEAYPTGPVAQGGVTDRLLSEYPNMFGDLSAGSGLGSMRRDEEHTRGFLDRHQDQIFWASDCADASAHWRECIGANGLVAVRQLAPNEEAVRKIVYENAARVLKIS
jgi:predicted TIM-barrel fold metal-dependent hydrolase